MSDDSESASMVLIRAPRPVNQFTPWPWGPVLSPWMDNPITISQALHHNNWRHVLESKQLFRCFYTMCADFFNSHDLPSELEEFVECERKAYRKAFEAAQKRVQKHKVDNIRQVTQFTEKVRMLHCYMGSAVPSGRDVRFTARFKFRYGPTLQAFGILLEPIDCNSINIGDKTASRRPGTAGGIRAPIPVPERPAKRPRSLLFPSFSRTTKTKTQTDQRANSADFYRLLAEYHQQPGGLPLLKNDKESEQVTVAAMPIEVNRQFDFNIINEEEDEDDKAEAILQKWARKNIVSGSGVLGEMVF